MSINNIPMQDQLTIALDEIRILQTVNEKQASELARMRGESQAANTHKCAHDLPPGCCAVCESERKARERIAQPCKHQDDIWDCSICGPPQFGGQTWRTCQHGFRLGECPSCDAGEVEPSQNEGGSP